MKGTMHVFEERSPALRSRPWAATKAKIWRTRDVVFNPAPRILYYECLNCESGLFGDFEGMLSGRCETCRAK